MNHPAPAEVLRFAERMARKVRANRTEQRQVRKITAARAEHDIACADELARWAKAYVLDEAPLN